MKKTITLMSTGLFLLSGAHFNFLFAQQFSKVSGGDIVNTPSDSRSVNIIDVNGDVFEDVFISNGLKGGQNNLLYLNNGNGTFTTETNNPIIEDNSPSVGASFGDIDNDGDIDACVTNWYGEVNNFYKNSGNGKFIVNTGLGNSGSYAETATWGDYDKDGFLDLYITNSAGGNKNMLYHNQGNGIFTRIFTGDLVNESDLSRNANWVDYDLDGDLDLFVTNEDNTANDLYENDGNGVLNKKYLGILTGSSKSSMSSSWVDIDNDGDMDLFIANAGYFQEQNNQIFRNDSGTFTLVDTGPVVSDGGCSYGSNFADYDNDGDLDLLVTNGYCNSNLKNFLYQNQGDGTFIRKDEDLPGLPEECSYGSAFGDVNQDGFLDLIIANCQNSQTGIPPKNNFYLNNGNNNHWIRVKLEGTMSNRSAIGATVRAYATINGIQVQQIRQMSSQSGYSGQNSLIAHFGLGDATMIDSVTVVWPLGKKMVLKNQNVDQILNLNEDMVISIDREIQRASFQMKVFPNPSSRFVYFYLTSRDNINNKDITLIMRDMAGREVWNEKVSVQQREFTYELNLRKLRLSKGTYQLQAFSGNDSSSQLLIVQ